MAVTAKKVSAKPKAVKPKAEKKVTEKVAKVVEKPVEATTPAPEKVETPKEVVAKAAPITTEGLPSLTDMLEAGVHFGHSVKRRNPRMDDYVYAVKNGVQIFDLVKTRDALAVAAGYLTETVAKGAQVLLVGTKSQAVDTIKSEAERLGLPFITTRWVGGLFTNWEQIKGRIARLLEMRQKFEAGEYKKYTKKEQVLLKREADRLERMYGGLVLLTKLPDVVFIVDPTREVTAMHEAISKEMPIVAICDTNCDPTDIQYVIPGNDDALKSVVMLITAVTGAIEKGQQLSKRNATTK
jgi:small subunit ribosomal protein S2